MPDEKPSLAEIPGMAKLLFADAPEDIDQYSWGEGEASGGPPIAIELYRNTTDGILGIGWDSATRRAVYTWSED